MKKTLIALSLLAAAALAPAQTTTTATVPTLQGALSRLSGTYLFDGSRRGKPTYAVTYEISKLTNVFGRGVDLSVAGILGTAGAGAQLGTGILYTRDVRFRVADELKGSLALTLGPALLADGSRTRLGFVAGISFRF